MLRYVDDIIFLGRPEDIAVANKDSRAEFDHTTIAPKIHPNGAMEHTFLGMRPKHKGRELTLSQPPLGCKQLEELDPHEVLQPADTRHTKAELERFEEAEAEGVSVTRYACDS